LNTYNTYKKFLDDLRPKEQIEEEEGRRVRRREEKRIKREAETSNSREPAGHTRLGNTDRTRSIPAQGRAANAQ